MRRVSRKISLLCALLMLLSAAIFLLSFPAPSGWEPVSPGIEFQAYRLSDPNNIFVVRADRQRHDWVLDTMVGQGNLRTGCEPLSSMANRYNGMVNYDKEKYEVVAAINGDYFSYETNRASGGQIAAGNFINRFKETRALACVGWKRDGSLFLDKDLTNASGLQQVFFQKGQKARISNINTERGPDQLILYTPQFADNTYSNNFGTELLVKANYPLLPGKAITGKIIERRVRQGRMPIPFGCLVLSGHGKSGQILESADAGDTVSIQLAIHALDSDGLSGPDKDKWAGTYAGISGDFWFVRNGTKATDSRISNWNGAARHPRTALAYNDRYLYFIVVDGRAMGSVGMTIPELAEFCISHLQVREALALDGGGSSTMVVKGKVKNRPCGYVERPIKNALLLATVSPARSSNAFASSQSVRASHSVDLRLGPDPNYEVYGQVLPGQKGIILPHEFNGIEAKGVNWWKCRFGNLEGWCPESALRQNLAKK